MTPRKKATIAVVLVALVVEPLQTRSFLLNRHPPSGATIRGRQRLQQPFFRPSPPPHDKVLGILQKKNEWRSSAPAAFLTTHRMNSNGEDGSFSLTTFIEQLAHTVSRPTPGLSTMALGFPLILAIAFFFLPLSSWLWLSTVFAGGAFLGRRLQDDEGMTSSSLEKEEDTVGDDDDDDAPPLQWVDGLALGAAIVAAGLFGNDESSSLLSYSNLSSIVGFGGIALALAVIFLEKEPSAQPKERQRDPELELMDYWDNTFRKRQSGEDSSEK